MADNIKKNEPQSIFAGGIVNNNNNDSFKSRLLNSTNSIRSALQSRNLYTPNVEYPNTNASTANKIVTAVDSLIGIITPFNSFSLKNSVFGRLTDSTPLTEVGTVMLAKQMALNSASHLSQQNLPTINLTNLFDGNKDTKLFTKNADLKITKKENNTLVDKFNNFVDKILFDASSSDESPFDKNSINSDYIKNTGEGQLNFLYQSLNNNLYKQDDDVLIEYGKKIKKPIQPRKNMINTQVGAIITDLYKPFFNFSDSVKHPYITIDTTYFAELPANQAMAKSYLINNDIQEYAPNKDFIKNNFGNTVIGEIPSLNDGLSNSWIDDTVEFKNDNINNKLVWGRDGLSGEANANIDQLRGNKDQVDNDYSDQVNDPTIREYNYNKFNIKSGLLEYTKNLINATSGKIGDVTRKAFIRDENGDIGFNGSGLWKSNNSIYAQKAEIAGKKGVRQHSQLDQYDRFTKAIRFNGNEVYNGNINSVTYKTVIPRIHPTLPLINGVPNNKNLMFSIENLAVGVISKGDVGIIDDEFGSQIPICEVGPFYGRIMWFPPYDMQLNETASAKYESTVMVGRNEPMYNYMNSERGATLSFMMIMDYPKHLYQYHNTQGKQREIAEFFAFGGDPYEGKKSPVDNPEAKIKQLQNEIEKITNKPDIEDPNVAKPKPIRVVFPNDVPFVSDNLNTIIDKMYTKYTYEIKEGLPSNGPYGDTNSYGFNKFIYIADDTTGVKASTEIGKYYLDVASLPVGFTQYTQIGDCELNKNLKDFFSNENNRKLYNISVFGGASKLYTEKNKLDIKEEEEYNKALGLRRCKSVIVLIKKRLAAIFGKDFDDLGIDVIYGGQSGDGTIGSQNSSQVNATEAAIPKSETKLERFASIEIIRNSNTPSSKKKNLTQEEIEIIRKKEEEIQELQKEIVKGNEAYDCVYNEKNAKTGILHGFQAVTGNYYSPAFHSQTPEDFHKRLTFLQQCVRQGAAKRYDVSNEDGILRAKNSVFGRQPICILRIGDFFYTKVVIDNITFDYTDAPLDFNPESFGVQPIFCKISIQMKVIGGQSLKGPIDALQNAVSFNYYANSTFTNKGMYKLPSDIADNQEAYMNGILVEKYKKMTDAYNNNVNK